MTHIRQPDALEDGDSRQSRGSRLSRWPTRSNLLLAVSLATLCGACDGGMGSAPASTKGAASPDLVARYGYGPQPDPSVTYQPDVVLIGSGPAADRVDAEHPAGELGQAERCRLPLEEDCRKPVRRRDGGRGSGRRRAVGRPCVSATARSGGVAASSARLLPGQSGDHEPHLAIVQPDVVQVNQQGHVSSGAATGSSAVGAVCLNHAGRPLRGRCGST